MPRFAAAISASGTKPPPPNTVGMTYPALAFMELRPAAKTQRQRFLTLNLAAASAQSAGFQYAALELADELLSSTRDWSNPEGQIDGRLRRARAYSVLAANDRGASDLDAAEALLPALASRPPAQAREAAEIAAARAFSLAVRDDAAALRGADDALAYFGGNVQIRIAELLLQRGRILARLGRPADAEASWRRGIAIVEDQRLVGIVTLQNLMHSMSLLAESRKLRRDEAES